MCVCSYSFNKNSLHFFRAFSGIKCKDPPTVNLTTWTEDKLTVEQVVIYKCIPGYNPVNGTARKTCSLRGQWTGNDLICEGGFYLKYHILLNKGTGVINFKRGVIICTGCLFGHG